MGVLAAAWLDDANAGLKPTVRPRPTDNATKARHTRRRMMDRNLLIPNVCALCHKASDARPNPFWAP